MHYKIFWPLVICALGLMVFIILCAEGVIPIKPLVDTTDTKLADSSHLAKTKINMPPPITTIIFGDNIGKISWGDGVMKFEGKADESAKIFFDEFLKPYADAYIKFEMEE